MAMPPSQVDCTVWLSFTICIMDCWFWINSFCQQLSGLHSWNVVFIAFITDAMHCMQFDWCFWIWWLWIVDFLLAHACWFTCLHWLCSLLAEVDFWLVEVAFLPVPCCKAALWLGSYTALFGCCFVIIIAVFFLAACSTR